MDQTTRRMYRKPTVVYLPRPGVASPRYEPPDALVLGFTVTVVLAAAIGVCLVVSTASRAVARILRAWRRV